MTSDGQKTSSRTPAWLKLVLVASLGLNLAVAGAIVGHRMGEGGKTWKKEDARISAPHRAKGPRGQAVGGGFLARGLSPEDRRALAQAFRAERRAGGDMRADLRARNQKMIAALRAVPFDPAALAALMQEGQRAGLARAAVGQSLLLDHIAGLTDAERAAFAERLEAMPRGPGRSQP